MFRIFKLGLIKNPKLMIIRSDPVHSLDILSRWARPFIQAYIPPSRTQPDSWDIKGYKSNYRPNQNNVYVYIVIIYSWYMGI